MKTVLCVVVAFAIGISVGTTWEAHFGETNKLAREVLDENAQLRWRLYNSFQPAESNSIPVMGGGYWKYVGPVGTIP